MHLLAEESVQIRCAVETAYEYACDLENFGRWFPGVIEIVAEDDLDLTTTGKSYLEAVSIPLRGSNKVRILVKEAQRSSIFITQGSLRPLLPRMEIRFNAIEPTGCRVNWRMYSQSKSVLVRVTLIPIARRIMRARAKGGMARLKLNLEAQSEA